MPFSIKPSSAKDFTPSLERSGKNENFSGNSSTNSEVAFSGVAVQIRLSVRDIVLLLSILLGIASSTPLDLLSSEMPPKVEILEEATKTEP